MQDPVAALLDKKGLASALSNFSLLESRKWSAFEIGSQKINRGSYYVGRWSDDPWTLLPEFIVSADDDLDDLISWLSATFVGMAPITQWCRIWRQTDFLNAVESQGSISTKGNLAAVWIGAIIAECAAQTSFKATLRDLPAVAALTTTMFAAARTSIVWNGRIPSREILSLYSKLSGVIQPRARLIKTEQMLSIAAILEGGPCEDKKLQTLAAVFGRYVDAGRPPAPNDILSVVSHIAANLELPLISKCAVGPQSERVVALDRLAVAMMANSDITFAEAVIGFAASLVDPGMAVMPELLRKFVEQLPVAPIWLGAFAGYWAPTRVLNDHQGLGRVVLKSLLSDRDFFQRPSADISYLEIIRWLDGKGDNRPSIRGFNGRNVGVEILPGVIVYFTYGQTAEVSAEIPSKTQANNKSAVRASYRSFEDLTLRVERLEEILQAALGESPSFLPKPSLFQDIDTNQKSGSTSGRRPSRRR